MQYALLIYTDEAIRQAQTPEESQQIWARYMGFNAEARAAGALLGGEALEGTATATSVRIRNGKRLTTDGPFAETKEALGGFYLIEAANLDEAIAWAAKIPSADHGTIEVRPVLSIKGDG